GRHRYQGRPEHGRGCRTAGSRRQASGFGHVRFRGGAEPGDRTHRVKRSATISVMAIAAAQLVAQGGHANETATPADLDAGQAELQAFAYDDDQGLRVMTWGAGVVQPVSSRLALTAQGYVDEITIVRPATHIHDPGAGVTGHAHDEVDIVTSASVSIGGGGRVEEKRYEGNLGFIYEMPSDEAPLVLNGSGRASTEPDYRSYAVQLGASSEFQ